MMSLVRSTFDSCPTSPCKMPALCMRGWAHGH